MPDPFAIISLVDTAFGLGCKIYAFFSALKDAPKEIHSFVEEVRVFDSVLEEVNETIYACEREYELYTKDRIKDLILKLYIGLLTFLRRSIQLMSQPTFKLIMNPQMSRSAVQDFQTYISNIRQLSASVMKEVEYLQRVELHEAHSRLRKMDRDQQRVLMAMKDQKEIMLSLKEEKKITTMINDQQTILQAVQSLQMKFSALSAVSVIVASNEEGLKTGSVAMP
jgi:hypothetical protein